MATGRRITLLLIIMVFMVKGFNSRNQLNLMPPSFTSEVVWSQDDHVVKHFLRCLRQKEPAPDRHWVLCRAHDHIMLNRYRRRGELPGQYIEALNVFYKNNQTAVNSFIRSHFGEKPNVTNELNGNSLQFDYYQFNDHRLLNGHRTSGELPGQYREALNVIYENNQTAVNSFIRSHFGEKPNVTKVFYWLMCLKSNKPKSVMEWSTNKRDVCRYGIPTLLKAYQSGRFPDEFIEALNIFYQNNQAAVNSIICTMFGGELCPEGAEYDPLIKYEGY